MINDRTKRSPRDKIVVMMVNKTELNDSKQNHTILKIIKLLRKLSIYRYYNGKI